MSLMCFFGLHVWQGCKCLKCGKNRNEEHDYYSGCKCRHCGLLDVKSMKHDWDDTLHCSQCGLEWGRCPNGHGLLRSWEGRLRCWSCGWQQPGFPPAKPQRCDFCGETSHCAVDSEVAIMHEDQAMAEFESCIDKKHLFQASIKDSNGKELYFACTQCVHKYMETSSRKKDICGEYISIPCQKDMLEKLIDDANCFFAKFTGTKKTNFDIRFDNDLTVLSTVSDLENQIRNDAKTLSSMGKNLDLIVAELYTLTCANQSKNRERIKDLGSLLGKIGGRYLMGAVGYRLMAKGCSEYSFSLAWDGISGWMA